MANIVELFKSVSRGISAEFEVVRHIPHRGESGRATEDVLKAFLGRHLPGRFEAYSGFAVGRDGAVSRQSDILLIDAINCPRFLRAEGTGVFPIDGVVALIEVTQRLTAAKRTDDAAKIGEFRALVSALQDSFAPDFQDSAPLGIMFAETSDASLATAAEWLAELWREVPIKRQLPNSIVVLDQGMVFYGDAAGNLHWDPTNARTVAYTPDAEHLLLLFLLFLMGRARTLIEHRIRARGRWIMAVRGAAPPAAPEAVELITNAMGAEPYFGDFTPYFAVEDRATFEQLVENVQHVAL